MAISVSSATEAIGETILTNKSTSQPILAEFGAIVVQATALLILGSSLRVWEGVDLLTRLLSNSHDGSARIGSDMAREDRCVNNKDVFGAINLSIQIDDTAALAALRAAIV